MAPKRHFDLMKAVNLAWPTSLPHVTLLQRFLPTIRIHINTYKE